MKVFVLIITVFVLISCNEKKSDRKVLKSGETTEISFDDEMHDFGRLTSGEIVVYTFVFTNTGENDFIIENTETDCECVNVNFSKNPVKPKNRGKIEIEFDTSGLIGRQLKTIEIHSNCKEPKHLIIFAEIKNEQIEFKS